jgi:hypothetical protein
MVYLLCALTSIASAVLLLRAARATKVHLLYWSSLCFFGMAANNVLLFVDVAVGPEHDWSLAPLIVAASSIMLLNIGMIWDAT